MRTVVCFQAAGTDYCLPVEATRAVRPVLDDPPELRPYAPGSWGPEAARALADPCGWVLGS